ncbi:Rieske (2Fe-2S) protein [Thermoplasma sp.]|uniref:Rieske (2Fe-2S) protein n=1 Tax=Thermoplasma sp. TaxID=1973142 RepID=UPI00126B4939|nr:Rieske (2Fe-2S) protein [Thermoplasma sp.]KAA8923130.1 MAG: Rieske (2Fe-2S) protein [Thermoplasma sp.]
MVYRKVSISTKVFESTNAIIAWVSGRPVLLSKYDGRYYAMDAVCGHMGCAILDRVEGREAVCPAHKARYDITSGKKTADAIIRPEVKCEYDNSSETLRTYPVRENNGFLEVDMP